MRIKEVGQRVLEGGMPAVAMTDLGNLYAAVKFYRACLDANVKPIFGVDISARINSTEVSGPLTILCRNNLGFRRLSALLTELYTAPRDGQTLFVTREQLRALGDTVIVIAGLDSEIGRLLASGHSGEASETVKAALEMFPGGFFLEISRTGRAGEDAFERGALDIAAKIDAPVVATNAVRFISPDDFEAHEIRTCIHQGRILDDPRRPRLFTAQQYLRSADEMVELFADLPGALTNSVEIAKRCNVFLDFDTTHMPRFPLAANESGDQELDRLSREGLMAYLRSQPDLSADNYMQRLDSEIETINRMGFASYFLIVADFIRWALENGVPVGPGRGSGAGSLVAFALGITRLDPIDHGLLFERFLNPERVSLPDFDIDFCMVGRDRVIDYVSQKYGADKVAQIITYNTLAARAVVRDVGRVMG